MHLQTSQDILHATPDMLPRVEEIALNDVSEFMLAERSPEMIIKDMNPYANIGGGSRR